MYQWQLFPFKECWWKKALLKMRKRQLMHSLPEDYTAVISRCPLLFSLKEILALWNMFITLVPNDCSTLNVGAQSLSCCVGFCEINPPVGVRQQQWQFHYTLWICTFFFLTVVSTRRNSRIWELFSSPRWHHCLEPTFQQFILLP